MGKIKQKVVRTIRNSQTVTDKNGRKHCKTCGAYVGNKGNKGKKK